VAICGYTRSATVAAVTDNCAASIVRLIEIKANVAFLSRWIDVELAHYRTVKFDRHALFFSCAICKRASPVLEK
jgi:hypothetical protein